MKKITLLKMMLLAIFIVGSINTFGQSTYNLVTSNSELVSGGKYLIATTSSGSGYSLGLQNTNNRASVAITVSTNTISTTAATASTDTKPFEITLGGTTGAWTLYDAVNATYLRPRTGANNGLQGNAVSQNWTISVAATGIATMVCENTTTYPRNILRFNSTNVPPLFACYASGQADVYLYKLAGTATPAATPTFSPTAGTYTSAQSVTLSSTTSGALIYYTTNGVDPTSASTLYTGAINIASTTTLKAIAYDSSNANPSSVASALYTINIATAAATPTFSPAAGTYTSAQSVTLSSTTSGALIYYTTNGVDPTNANTLYTGAINVASTTTVKAIAYDSSNANPSSVASATYTIVVPTITVTETSIPSMTAIVGETDSETINVSGTNLTENIAISITGTNAAMFSVSPTSITQTGGTASNTSVTITYTPTATGSHTATFQLTSAGAATVTRTLTGTATFTPLSTPVAKDATSIGETSFTANWEEVVGATSYQLNVYTQTTGANATDLFISEYGEGSSNNKYIEIYNGTGSSVDLSQYTLKQAYNGGGWDKDITYTLPLSGTLANNDVYIIATSTANATILAQADLSIVYSTTNQGGRVPSFTGNDAMGLFKNSSLIDVFGDPASSNAITVAGYSTWATDHTLVRKSSVNTPTTDWNTSAGSDEATSQWEGYAQDTWTYLGSHTMSGGASTTLISGSPFTVSAPATSYSVTGLTTNTTYYYDLTASNTNTTSELSETKSATTDPVGGSGLNNNKIENISAANGKVRFDAIAGESVEIYNSIGQKLINKTAVDGQNTIDLPSLKGIIIVKVGNKTAKVVL